MRVLKKSYIFIQGFLVINLLWLTASLIMNTNVVPNPLLVYKDFGKIINNGLLLHVFYSLKRVGLGLLLSTIIGLIVGILMAVSKKCNKILNPIVYFSYPIPKTALLPIAMILLGMRDGSKVLIMFLIMVFQIIVAVRDAVLKIDETMYQILICSGANKLQILRHVIFPAMLPDLFTSIRISLGTAVSVLFFVESYGTKYGMGYYIVNAWSRINYIDMYGGIIVISVVGFLLFTLIDFISDFICKWNS
jgi:NitT/TauT family transport system permease protein